MGRLLFSASLNNQIMINKNLLVTFIMLFSITQSFAQTTFIWNGGGDGHSWNDGNNWNQSGAVPGAGDYVAIRTTVTIDGTAANAPARILVDQTFTVTLDLDVTVTETASTVNNIQVSGGGTLNLGAGTARTFTLSTSNNSADNLSNINVQDGTLNIAANAIVNCSQSSFGVRQTNASSRITNNGTINVTNYVQQGIQLVTSGSQLDNNSSIAINTPGTGSSSGILMSSGTTVNNNSTGTITVTKALDDGISIQSSSTLNNAGILNLTGQDAATSSNTPLLNNGNFNNNSGGTLNADGGASGSCRAIFNNSGTTTNAGTINGSNGDVDRMLFNNSGTVTNSVCGIINLTLGRILVNGGSFTNNGLYKTTHSAAGVNAAGGTATNNAFYTSNNANWAVGAGTKVDNGVKLSSSNFDVDAGSSCTPNLGIDAAHNWFSDVGATTQVGSNDASGSATFTNDVFANAGPHELYSCYGSDVKMTISNLAGACILPVELVSFEGIIKGEQVELNWMTVSEQDNKGFDIERAYRNGSELVWEKIGFVEGNGTTFEEQTYIYFDEIPAKTTNYYRLKQLDYDGAFEYSNIISVEFNQVVNNIKIFPNPAQNQLNIENGVGQVTIFNLLGQPVLSEIITDAFSTISLDNLPNGQYFLQINRENGVSEIQKFVKSNY